MRIIRNLSFAFLFIGGLSIAATAQKLTYAGAPKAEPKTASTESYFAQLLGTLRVYKIQDDSGEDRQTYFEVRDGAKAIGRFDASVNASGGSLENFFAFYGDLDKNKSAELVVVDFDGQSLGLGVNNYTINIFPDFQTKGVTAPLTFKTAEFGKDGTFRYDAKTNETLILLTEWGGVQIRDKSKRGDGTYFTGRYFRYENGKLKPAVDQPILARRYVNSFERERFRTDKSPLRPFNWLSSAQTIKLKGDPVFDEKPFTSERGTIEKFETVTENFKSESRDRDVQSSVSQITVRLDSGATKTIVVAKDNYFDELPEKANRIVPDSFGMLPAKFSFPSDFNPLLSLGDLTGMKVQLNSYKLDNDATPFYKLWFIQ